MQGMLPSRFRAPRATRKRAHNPYAVHGSCAYPQPRALPAIPGASRNPHAAHMPSTHPIR